MRMPDTDVADKTHVAMRGYLHGAADELERDGNRNVADVLRRYADREWQKYVVQRQSAHSTTK